MGTSPDRVAPSSDPSPPTHFSNRVRTMMKFFQITLLALTAVVAMSVALPVERSGDEPLLFTNLEIHETVANGAGICDTAKLMSPAIQACAQDPTSGPLAILAATKKLPCEAAYTKYSECLGDCASSATMKSTLNSYKSRCSKLPGGGCFDTRASGSGLYGDD